MLFCCLLSEGKSKLSHKIDKKHKEKNKKASRHFEFKPRNFQERGGAKTVMKICRVFKFAELILSYIFFSIVIGHFIFLFFFLCGRGGGVSSDYFIIFLLNNLLRVTNFAIRCVFESARLVPENRTVSVFASHHNSSQENLKFSSSLTTQKTKMKKLLASMPSIRNTSHVRGMVCFISLCF